LSAAHEYFRRHAAIAAIIYVTLFFSLLLLFFAICFACRRHAAIAADYFSRRAFIMPSITADKYLFAAIAYAFLYA